MGYRLDRAVTNSPLKACKEDTTHKAPSIGNEEERIL